MENSTIYLLASICTLIVFFSFGLFISQEEEQTSEVTFTGAGFVDLSGNFQEVKPAVNLIQKEKEEVLKIKDGT